MTEDERRSLGRKRRLVFQNLANGLPVERIMVDLKLSQLEVDNARRFVARKITEFRVLKKQPPIACESVSAIKFNRRRLLGVLAHIGDLSLSTDLITLRVGDEEKKFSMGKITVQSIDHPEMVEGVSRRMSEAYNR